jgi:hypothetical protein
VFLFHPERYHRFWWHGVSVFWPNHNFAFVLRAAKEKAEGTFDLFLYGEFFNNLVKSFVMMKSEDKNSSKVGFSVVQFLTLFVKTGVANIKEFKLEKLFIQKIL